MQCPSKDSTVVFVDSTYKVSPAPSSSSSMSNGYSVGASY